MSVPSFDMLYWVFARLDVDGFSAVAGPYLDRDLAERQAAMAKGYVVGASVMFLADRRTNGLPPVDS